MRWILYSRNDCPLCEYAANLLQAAGAEFECLDIDADPSLKQAYDLRVPVIGDRKTGRELGFPFEPWELVTFIEDSQVARQ